MTTRSRPTRFFGSEKGTETHFQKNFHRAYCVAPGHLFSIPSLMSTEFQIVSVWIAPIVTSLLAGLILQQLKNNLKNQQKKEKKEKAFLPVGLAVAGCYVGCSFHRWDVERFVETRLSKN